MPSKHLGFRARLESNRMSSLPFAFYLSVATVLHTRRAPGIRKSALTLPSAVWVTKTRLTDWVAPTGAWLLGGSPLSSKGLGTERHEDGPATWTLHCDSVLQERWWSSLLALRARRGDKTRLPSSSGNSSLKSWDPRGPMSLPGWAWHREKEEGQARVTRMGQDGGRKGGVVGGQEWQNESQITGMWQDLCAFRRPEGKLDPFSK